MRIEAEGCALRPIRESDVDIIVAAMRDPEVVHWLPNIPQPYGPADARSFIAVASSWLRAGRDASFAIVDERDTLLGVVGVRASEDPPTVGYWVAAEARGLGLATAATSALCTWAFRTFACPRLALHAEQGNIASRRVAEKCGFARVDGTVLGVADRELWVFELWREADALRRAP
ncbi:MAG: GNAT family N-acetyltransferase [Gaiellales bacterium]